jgi:hypothetical protein
LEANVGFFTCKDYTLSGRILWGLRALIHHDVLLGGPERTPGFFSKIIADPTRPLMIVKNPDGSTTYTFQILDDGTEYPK